MGLFQTMQVSFETLPSDFLRFSGACKLPGVLTLSVFFGLYPCFFLFYGFHSGFHLVLAQCFLSPVKVSGDATECFVLVCQFVDPITHLGGFGTLPAEPLLQPIIIVSQIQKCVVDGAENLNDPFQQRLGHERVQTTMETYSHLYPNKQAEVAMQLDGLATND